MQVLDEVIDRPAEEGARVVALAQLEACDQAAAALGGEGGDGCEEGEALHDFRVGLRRLRSLLRAFRPFLADSVRPRDGARLRRLADRTGAARDAEVQLAWLAGVGPSLEPKQRAGLELLRERYAARADGGAGRGELVTRYRHLAARLAKRLDRYQGRVTATGGASFGAALARLLQDHMAALAERLGVVEGGADQARAHRARIAAKRLRYLLEPLRGNPHADASAAVKRLKGLQDLLGELHDRHVLGDEVASALQDDATARARELHARAWLGAAGARAAAEGFTPRRTGGQAGLLAILRRAREERDLRWEKLVVLRGEGLRALAAEVELLVNGLHARAGLDPSPAAEGTAAEGAAPEAEAARTAGTGPRSER